MTKKILLVTDGIFHPPLRGRMTLHRVLRQMDGFSFEHIRSLEKLPENPDNLAALVLHYHHKRISPPALAKLDAFVRNGGGVLAIHAATASFKDNLPYYDILGGRFIGHGPVESFECVNLNSELFKGIPDFIVKDELYIHELNPNIQTHFTAKHESQEVPVVWTYRHGKGKVFYSVPGHLSASMSNPAYQQVLKRGFTWVTE